MNTIRFTNQKKLWEIVLRYFMYLASCVFVVELLVMLTLLDHITLKQFILYGMPEILKYIAIPVFILTFWYGGSKVMSIEYDYDNKALCLWHYDWLLRRRHRQISFENLSFKVYHVVAPFLFYRVTLILLSDKCAKRTLAFTSGLGWKRKQVDKIVDMLKEIKEPVADW